MTGELATFGGVFERCERRADGNLRVCSRLFSLNSGKLDSGSIYS